MKTNKIWRVTRLVLLFTLASAVAAAPSVAKYVSTGGTSQPLTVVWSDPQTKQGIDKTNADPSPNSLNYTVTDGINDGWYAIIAWGAIGAWGTGISGTTNNPGGWGTGGCVRCIVWLNGGAYTIVAGSAGREGASNPSMYYGGGAGYPGTYIGGGGGGLSGVFKGSVSKANAIAVAGGGGGGAGNNAGSANGGDYGGNGAGGLTGGIGTGLVSTLWPGTDNAVLKIAEGEAPGGSSRDNSAITADGAGDYERGAGGGRYNLHAGTSTRLGGDNVNVLNGGGHSIWPHFNDTIKPNPSYTQPGSTTDMTGGSAGAVNNGVGGGGGAGYQGGGAGGNSSGSTSGNGNVSMGGGGGGSSYIIPRVTSTNPDFPGVKASRSYQTGDSSAAGGFSGLQPKVVAFLNGLAVPRNAAHTSGYHGVVVMAYLGPSDEIFNTGSTSFLFNW